MGKQHFIPYIEDTVFDDKGQLFKRAMNAIGNMEIKWDGKFVFYVRKQDDVVSIKTKFGRWLSSTDDIVDAYQERALPLMYDLLLIYANIIDDNIQNDFMYQCDFMFSSNDIDRFTGVFQPNTSLYKVHPHFRYTYNLGVSINTLFINDVMMCPSDYQNENKIFHDSVINLNDIVSIEFKKNPQLFRLFILESDFNQGSTFQYNFKPSWKLLLIKFLDHSYMNDVPRTVENMLEFLGKDATKPFREFVIQDAYWIDQFFEFVWDKHIMYIKQLMLELLDNSLTNPDIFVNHREGYIIKDYVDQKVYKIVDKADFMKYNRLNNKKESK